MLKYQIIGDSYICTTISLELICQKADMLLKTAMKKKADRDARVADLRRWLKKATDGDSRIEKDYTVIVEEIKRKEK